VVPWNVSVQATDFAVADENCPQVRFREFPAKLNSGAEAEVELGSTAMRVPFDDVVKTSAANGRIPIAGVSLKPEGDAPAAIACTTKATVARARPIP
jgi:hypothetical protein